MTAAEGGQRPGVLKEPEPQLVGAVLWYRAALPSLGSGPDHDDALMRFLVAQTLAESAEEAKKEQKERLMMIHNAPEMFEFGLRGGLSWKEDGPL